jgi:hypothetical protein
VGGSDGTKSAHSFTSDTAVELLFWDSSEVSSKVFYIITRGGCTSLLIPLEIMSVVSPIVDGYVYMYMQVTARVFIIDINNGIKDLLIGIQFVISVKYCVFLSFLIK